jgi:hypothetical protein
LQAFGDGTAPRFGQGGAASNSCDVIGPAHISRSLRAFGGFSVPVESASKQPSFQDDIKLPKIPDAAPFPLGVAGGANNPLLQGRASVRELFSVCDKRPVQLLLPRVVGLRAQRFVSRTMRAVAN